VKFDTIHGALNNSPHVSIT